MERSEQINELAAALSKAQAEIEPAAKEADNPAFKSKFADLASVWEACRGPLTKHGLSVVQLPETGDVGGGEIGVGLRTTLMHTSGQFVSGFLPLAFDRTKMQSLGSAITYGRRYSLAAAVGIVAEVDDDGHQAVSPHHDSRRAPQSDVNGHPEHRAPVSQSRAAPTDGAHSHDQQRGEAKQYGDPKTGKQLYAWCKRKEEEHQVGLLHYLNQWAKLQDIPGRTVDWDAETTALALAEAYRKLDSVAVSN